MKILTLLMISAATVLAGPPLVCHPVHIGDAKSLPWRNVNGWNGTDPSYDVTKLSTDTLTLLTPSAALPLRMETLRRAAIYSAKSQALAAQLTSQLLARVADWEAAGKPSANAWFDAGYFVESLRQVGFIYRWEMLTPAEKAQWQLRGEDVSLDGKPWIEKAIRMNGKGMEVVLVKIEEYRQADLKRKREKLVSAK